MRALVANHLMPLQECCLCERAGPAVGKQMNVLAITGMEGTCQQGCAASYIHNEMGICVHSYARSDRVNIFSSQKPTSRCCNQRQ